MKLSFQEVKLRVDEALKEVDMTQNAQRMSHHLSFGEKKRASIAAVLSMKPKILVLDEPSSNLDPRHRREIINLLKSFNITKIIASHDLDMVLDLCERVILLRQGKVIAQGSAREILSNKKLLVDNGLELPISLAK
jgi:cobalt/nickel transport system ATP-binding protein